MTAQPFPVIRIGKSVTLREGMQIRNPMEAPMSDWLQGNATVKRWIFIFVIVPALIVLGALLA